MNRGTLYENQDRINRASQRPVHTRRGVSRVEGQSRRKKEKSKEKKGGKKGVDTINQDKSGKRRGNKFDFVYQAGVTSIRFDSAEASPFPKLCQPDGGPT